MSLKPRGAPEDSMTNSFWTIREAKSRLPELPRLARAGQPQIIGAQEPRVVLSLEAVTELRRYTSDVHLGQWLLDSAPKVDFQPPGRRQSRPNKIMD